MTGSPDAGPDGLARFTKGPWTAARMVHEDRGGDMTPEEIGEYISNSVRKTREAGGYDHFLFITASDAKGSADVCHVGNGPGGPANVYLIAAAPDLYAALEEAKRFISAPKIMRHPTPGRCEVTYDCPQYNALTAKMRAALARARGEQP